MYTLFNQYKTHLQHYFCYAVHGSSLPSGLNKLNSSYFFTLFFACHVWMYAIIRVPNSLLTNGYVTIYFHLHFHPPYNKHSPLRISFVLAFAVCLLIILIRGIMHIENAILLTYFSMLYIFHSVEWYHWYSSVLNITG